jgi:ribosomal protein L7Ae-like RNA K-turn-binding protein
VSVRVPVCIVATISRLGEACGAHEVESSARSSQAIDPPITAPVTAANRTIGSARVIVMPPLGAH